MPGNISWYILVNFILLRFIEYALFIWNHTTLPLVKQELPTLPEHLNSLLVFSGVCVALSVVFSVVFCSSLFVPICFYFLTIVLYINLNVTDYDYPFGIFKLF